MDLILNEERIGKKTYKVTFESVQSKIKYDVIMSDTRLKLHKIKRYFFTHGITVDDMTRFQELLFEYFKEIKGEK